MRGTASTPTGRDSSARDRAAAIAGYVAISVLLGGSAVLLGSSVRSALTVVLAVGGVFVLGEVVEYFVRRFSLPNAVNTLFTGVGLLAVRAWGILAGESPIVIAFAAFAAGWIANDGVRSLRRTASSTERT